MTQAMTRRSWLFAAVIIGTAALLRLWLIAVEGVSFDSDEALVGLMARHIAHGTPIPTFFYGQAYMGSLDAILIAGGFVLGGESVTVMRLVQLALVVAGLFAAYGLLLAITNRARIALSALLLLALPTPLAALYTTLTLGGYNELVLFGSLILLLGWQITIAGRRDLWRWVLLGLLTGVGWWTNGAIVTPALIVLLLGIYTRAWRDWRGVLLAGALFLIGGAPWWVYNLRHDWAALDFLVKGYDSDTEQLSTLEALFALLLLGLPALYGLRLPWEAGFALSPWSLLAGVVYLLLITDLIVGGLARRRTGNDTNNTPEPDDIRRAQHWVRLTFSAFAGVFVFSSFEDATGRYLLPLWVPAALGIALGLERLATRSRKIAGGALIMLLVAQAATVIGTARTDTGLQPQLVARLQIPRGHDQDVIDFLHEQGFTHGYASYWTAYRLDFLAHESIVLESTLPHETKTKIGSGNRYTPYATEVAAAARVVWITQNFPELDTFITQQFAAQDITCAVREFGPYRVYYNFSARVAPADIGLTEGVPFSDILAAASIPIVSD